MQESFPFGSRVPNAPGQTAVLRVSRPLREPQKFREVILEDRYELRVALRRERLVLTCSSKRLYEGQALPGMVRVLSPGEEVCGVLYTSTDTVVLQSPGASMRAMVLAACPQHRKGSVSFIDALLQPSQQLEHNGRMALQAERFDRIVRRTRQSL